MANDRIESYKLHVDLQLKSHSALFNVERSFVGPTYNILEAHGQIHLFMIRHTARNPIIMKLLVWLAAPQLIAAGNYSPYGNLCDKLPLTTSSDVVNNLSSFSSLYVKYGNCAYVVHNSFLLCCFFEAPHNDILLHIDIPFRPIKIRAVVEVIMKAGK